MIAGSSQPDEGYEGRPPLDDSAAIGFISPIRPLRASRDSGGYRGPCRVPPSIAGQTGRASKKRKTPDYDHESGLTQSRPRRMASEEGYSALSRSAIPVLKQRGLGWWQLGAQT